MRLRHGVTVEQAIKVLEERISSAQQVINDSGSDGRRPAYLTWVDATQQHLRTVFADTEIEDSLLERGYWHICGMASQFDHQMKILNRIIGEELAFQVGHPGIFGNPGGRLGEIASQLRELRRLASREGCICVPDTNALLHYKRFDELPWIALLRKPLVRLVFPIVVVRELDAKKYARREEFQGRARDLLTLIDRFVSASPPDGYSEVRSGVTVEVLPDERGHLRMPGHDNDEEILERCEFLRQVTGDPVTLITGDSGMRITAQSRGIDVFKLSSDNLLPKFKQQDGLTA